MHVAYDERMIADMLMKILHEAQCINIQRASATSTKRWSDAERERGHRHWVSLNQVHLELFKILCPNERARMLEEDRKERESWTRNQPNETPSDGTD